MKIHTIQLNIEDFESGTMHLSAEEKGVYISLIICLYKISTHKLPNDDARLARMAGVNLRKWNKIKPNIIDKFIVTDAFWEQKRVRQEVDRCHTLGQKNRANALKNNKTGEPVAMPNESQKAANTKNKELRPKNKEKNMTDVVMREEGKRHVLIGKRISKITGWENDPSWFGSYARIEMWISNGWDEELDIIPTIESIMAKRNGDPPSTLNYFEKAIASTHATRTKPLPKGEIKNDKRSERLRLRAESTARVLAKAAENERKRKERGDFIYDH